MVNSKWNLVYCFSKKLSVNDSAFEQILHLLKKSIEYNKRFHHIKLYTDSKTYYYLKNLNVEVEILDIELFFLDDFKLKVLEKLKDNEILIDVDIFLYSPLIVDSNCDLFADHSDDSQRIWYVDDFKEAKKFKFSNFLNLPEVKKEMTNIGILKFFNKNLLNEYINLYNKIKKTAISEKETLPKFPKFSILIGQLSLRNIIDKNNYKVKYAVSNPNNHYSHLAGERKYNNNWVENILKPIKKNLL